MLRGAAGTARLERVAALAVADIEVIPDDGEHHRVRADTEADRLRPSGSSCRAGRARCDGRTSKACGELRLEAERTGHVPAVYGQLDRR